MYDINNIKLGEILKKYRKLKHYSLEDIGNRIYKTKATVSKYENGEIIPDFITVLELCNILNIEISNLFPSISEVFTSNLPFNNNVLYLYYFISNKLITATIKIDGFKDGKYYAFIYSGIQKDFDNCKYYYEGTVEPSQTVTYMNFRNINYNKNNLEQVQIIINIPISNTSEKYDCFITGLTPNYLPIIKKGIITTTLLDSSQIDIKKIQISKQELQKISIDNAWILDTII